VRAAMLKHVAEEHYAFVLKSTLDVQHASYTELEEVFQNTFNMKNDICHKCIRFFIEYCKDADIPLSSKITKNEKRRIPIKE
jgi:hypothetical protein